MKWIKKGCIYCPDGTLWWTKHSVTTPTPVLINPTTIRVYAGFRDHLGVSRIGFVDIDARNPGVVKRVSQRPALDVGKPGAFDDNGMILGDVVKKGSAYYMYYVGFQIPSKVKFLAFSGLAVSHDHGETFQRVSDVPILDRTPQEYHIRAIHSVIHQKNIWKAWYGTGSSWEIIDDKPYPRYSIKYVQSPDGKRFPQRGTGCIPLSRRGEYRIGRPRVCRESGRYLMFYTRGFRDHRQLPGYAVSRDGIRWTRRDRNIGITISAGGWDSHMLCYPTIFRYRRTTYMFYNGNGMGKTGFGYAILAPGAPL